METGKKGLTSILIILFTLILAALIALYFITEAEETKKIAIFAFIAIFVMTLILIYLHVGFSARLMRRNLKKIEEQVAEGSLEELKETYLKLYKVYLKLSEKKKQNFYGKLAQIREKVEDMLRAEKKIQKMLDEVTEHKDITKKRPLYDQMQSEFKKLPSKTQEKYFPHLNQLKEDLETGN